MISNLGLGFAAPTGWQYDFLTDINAVNRGLNEGPARAKTLLEGVYGVNQAQMNLNNQGTNELIGDIGRSTTLTQGLTGNLDAQRELFMAQCAANGNDPNQCRAIFDASVGRAPQQTQTQGPQMSYAPNVGLDINSVLGLR